MSKSPQSHILQFGQELHVKWREASGNVLENLRRMRLTPDGGHADPLAYVVFIDKAGVSIRINRYSEFGGLMEAFLPAELVAWQAYFEPLDVFHPAFVGSRHFARKFPLDFI